MGLVSDVISHLIFFPIFKLKSSNLNISATNVDICQRGKRRFHSFMEFYPKMKGE